MKLKMLFALAMLVVMVAPVTAQQFELVAGTAQIGHTPGRIDVLRPIVKKLSPGQHVSFDLTLRWPDGAPNPCSKGHGCIALVGIRHTQDAFLAAWSTFTFTTPTDPVMKLDLPSKADEHLPRKGCHSVFVIITERVTNPRDNGRLLYVVDVPVAINVNGCLGK